MPYQPNQQYDTQSLGNGIAAAGQNLAQGFQQYQVNQAKDKVAQGELAGLLQSNPNILQGADPEIAKKLEKFKNGETGLKDNIFLLGWANMTQKGIEQKQQLQQQALANQAQQLKINEFLQNKAEEDVMKTKLGQMSSGVGNGVYSAKTQDNPVSKYAANLFAATGKVPTNDVLEKFATARYGGETSPLELGTVNGTDAQGRPIESTINKRTGAVLGSRVIAPAGVLMPEDAAKAAQLTGRVTQAMKDNQDTIENGKTSVQSLYAIDNTKRLLAHMQAAGNDTGALAPLKAEAQNVAKSLGLNIGDPSDMQALKAAVGPMVIGDIKEVTSRMTNMELSAFQKFTANPSNTPEANAAILAAREATHRRQLQLAQMTNDLRRTPDYKSGKLTEGDINDQVNEYQLKNPIPIPGLTLSNPVGGSVKPSVQSINLLKQHPEMRSQFDERYGKGAADFYLK